jgi:two-component system alkaline phosphatase synthesis response regulator PhoP
MSRSRPRVVVVDDDHNLLNLLKEFLVLSGFDAVGLPGIASISEIAQEAPNLVLLDVHMPGLSGKEVLRRVRDDTQMKDVPVILITAFQKSLDETSVAMADGVVEKPFDLDQLVKTISRNLR